MRAGPSRLLVLCDEFSHTDIWWRCSLWCQFCAQQICELANILCGYWSIDNNHRASRHTVPTRLASESFAILRCRESGSLDESQRQPQVSRQQRDLNVCLQLYVSGTQNAHIKKDQVLESFKDLRIWLVFLATMLSSIPNGGISNFSSILLTTFGYTNQQALIYNMPTGAIGVVVVLLTGYLSDKWRDRSLVMFVCIIPTIIAGALMIGLDPGGHPANKAGLLAASFLSGTFGAAFMLLLAWNASNIAGHSKKVTANALTLIAFCVGNILGTQTFQQKQAPGYISGKISIIATLGALCFVIVALRLYNDYLNRENSKILAGMSEEEKDVKREKLAFADQTDRHNVFFVYTH